MEKSSRNFLLVSVVFGRQQEVNSLILGKVVSEGYHCSKGKAVPCFSACNMPWYKE